MSSRQPCTCCNLLFQKMSWKRDLGLNSHQSLTKYTCREIGAFCSGPFLQSFNFELLLLSNHIVDLIWKFLWNLYCLHRTGFSTCKNNAVTTSNAKMIALKCRSLKFWVLCYDSAHNLLLYQSLGPIWSISLRQKS